MKRFLIAITLLFIILFLGCKTDSDKIQLKQLVLFPNLLDKPIRERMIEAPEIFLEEMRKMDSTNTYKTHKPTDNEITLFIEYYQYLPQSYQDLINNKIIGIYLIDNFKGGGWFDIVSDENGEIYSYLAFNPLVFTTSLSDWATFRDNSIFSSQRKDIELKSVCNTNMYELIHSLLHETSHLYDYYYNITPYFYRINKPKNLKASDYWFTESIWLSLDKPIPKYDFPNRNKISHYGLGKTIDSSEMLEIYQNLSNTPFCSLYGSVKGVEDFAECFSWWYLYKHFNIEYKVLIISKDELLFTFTPTHKQFKYERIKQLDLIH